MTGASRAAPVPIRDPHSPRPTAAIAAAASQRHNPPEPRPRPTARTASPLSDGSGGSVAAFPPGKCSRRPSFPFQLDDALNYVSHKASRESGPPFCVTRQVVGSHVRCSVLSPPPAWVAWRRRGEVDGRGGGVADATAPTILEPAWRKGLSPTHSRRAFAFEKSLRIRSPGFQSVLGHFSLCDSEQIVSRL